MLENERKTWATGIFKSTIVTLRVQLGMQEPGTSVYQSCLNRAKQNHCQKKKSPKAVSSYFRYMQRSFEVG